MRVRSFQFQSAASSKIAVQCFLGGLFAVQVLRVSAHVDELETWKLARACAAMAGPYVRSSNIDPYSWLFTSWMLEMTAA
jgi:hypothetical protein